MRLRIAFSLGVVALAVWALVQAPAPRSLAGYVPAGPMLYLEATDFAALERDWNGSAEKKLWLESPSYDVFSRSRLYERLAGAQAQYAAAAGLAVDMPLVEAVAGGETALAIYDIGKLEFLYITRLPSARAMQSVLWRTRGSYETRQAAGVDYFVRTDAESHRAAAFAATNDYLLVATREDLIPAALKLLAGSGGAAVTGEEWFSATVGATGARGDLRMVMNLPALVRSPHFRSYWVQRNVSELRQYGGGIADVFRSPSEIREQRVLLRFSQAPSAAPGDALGQVLRLAPDDAGLYRAWANPTPEAALNLVAARILAPQAQAGRASEMAPEAPQSAAAGSEADLETRIDEPPIENTGNRFVPDALRRLIEGAKLEAMLETGSTRTLADGVFVGIDSAVALLASTDWNAEAVRDALSTAAETGPLGRIAFQAQGRVLVVGNSAALVRRMTARIANAPMKTGGDYAAGFNPARERANFEKMTKLIDSTAAGEPREPRFFSENMASLGRTLGRVNSSSIVVRDTGRAVASTVVYRFGP
jgi:hypothetical protein